MTTADTPAKRSQSTAWSIRALPLLAALGIALSVYSLYHYLAIKQGLNLGQSFCNISATLSCDTVNQSPYSTILGVPLPVLGLLFYLAVFFASWILAPFPRLLIALLSPFTIFSALLSVALGAVSHFLIGALCPSCLVMYLINFILLGITLGVDREHSVGQKLVSGIGIILSFPKKLRSGDALALAGARSGFGVAVLVCALAFSASDLVFNRLLVPYSQQAQASEQLAELIESYEQSKPLEVSHTTEGYLADYSKGSSDAPVHIVEFSDFQCPFCRELAVKLDELIERSNGALRLTHKDFPLDKSCNRFMEGEMHKAACIAASFARCAGEQGRFWDVTQALYTEPELEQGISAAEAQTVINRIGEQLRLDTAAIASCMVSERPYEKIKADIEEGAKLGLEGTPFILINGRAVGPVSFEALSGLLSHIRSQG